MPVLPLLAAPVLALSTPAAAPTAPDALERGFTGALKACEEWVLDPASWALGPEAFAARVGLGEAMGQVASVNEAALPPPPLRRANRYWRINSTPDAGYILVVSEDLPMCHITGGGRADLQPVVTRVLASAQFAARWEAGRVATRSGLTSTTFRSRTDPGFSMVVSHATLPGGRSDRVQLQATAIYDPAK
ncbi:MAG TPA: hypothetical protein VMQ93_00610 [Novosphingobium sp.]|nr:hypothetical protein [Novosphingobium sp.]